MTQKWLIPRRTLLRGTGAALALPLLEAMLPSSALASSPKPTIPRRMGVFYLGTGMNMRQFTPVDFGKDFSCTRILKPLEKFRDDMTVLSGTFLQYGGSHQGDYTFLTGTKAHTPSGIHNTISADQVASAHIGRETRFPSLQFSISRGTGFGGSMKTLSWNKNGVPLAAESNPREIFNRLFRSDDAAKRTMRRREFRRRQSVLDAVQEQARRLGRRISQNDKQKLDEYLTSVREVEQQLQRDIDWSEERKPTVNPPDNRDFRRAYDPESTRNFHYESYAKMMYDLVTLAFQTDSTRVLTYVVRQELRGGVYPEFHVTKDYHSLTHHNNDPKNLEELAKVDTIYMTHWAYLLNRMKSMKQPDGSSLLDHTMLAFSSGMGMGHSRDLLPTALFGGSQLGISHQGHLKLPDDTPLACLWHPMLDRMNVPIVKPFQDSKGVIREVTA